MPRAHVAGARESCEVEVRVVQLGVDVLARCLGERRAGVDAALGLCDVAPEGGGYEGVEERWCGCDSKRLTRQGRHRGRGRERRGQITQPWPEFLRDIRDVCLDPGVPGFTGGSEEHTSELQSRET